MFDMHNTWCCQRKLFVTIIIIVIIVITIIIINIEGWKGTVSETVTFLKEGQVPVI